MAGSLEEKIVAVASGFFFFFVFLQSSCFDVCLNVFLILVILFLTPFLYSEVKDNLFIYTFFFLLFIALHLLGIVFLIDNYFLSSQLFI